MGLTGLEFRPAKRNAFRVIQKRGYRLGTRMEVGEIKSSKRKRNVKWW